jgi:hypothetical protein
MPFFKGTKSRAAQILAKGWQLSGTYIWQQGTPLTITTSSGISGGFAVRRPDRVADSQAAYDLSAARQNAENGTPWFNTSAFVNPPEYRMGNAGRTYNDVRRDNYRNLNLSVARNFPIRERLRGQFRAEFLNALNQVIFGTPGSDVATPSTFGLITTQGNTPRSIQAVMRFTF